jgi:prepilin-type processing-associated H-X9-DG protein
MLLTVPRFALVNGMEENFVGYVLEALDPETQREVEEYLRDNPQAQGQVALLRQALEPLQADAEEIDPPPGLAIRTLAGVAEYCCRDLPRAPIPTNRWAGAAPTRWWRRADVLVAASLLLGASLLLPPLIGYLHRQQEMASCRDNLRVFGEALVKYSQGHRGAFPHVASREQLGKEFPAERRVAGLFLPMLVDAGLLDPETASLRCPGNPGNSGSARCSWHLQDLEKMPDKDFKGQAPLLCGCYAYTLGFLTDKGIEGYRQDTSPPMPILSDRPRYQEESAAGENSPNHGGRGQNVLFTDGHVAFLTSRTVAGDDIFLNLNQRVAAGLRRQDIVLGVSDARPEPPNSGE